jgi:hypothetical protein
LVLEYAGPLGEGKLISRESSAIPCLPGTACKPVFQGQLSLFQRLRVSTAKQPSIELTLVWIHDHCRREPGPHLPGHCVWRSADSILQSASGGPCPKLSRKGKQEAQHESDAQDADTDDRGIYQSDGKTCVKDVHGIPRPTSLIGHHAS